MTSDEILEAVERQRTEGWKCCGCGAPPPFACNCVTEVAWRQGHAGSCWKAALLPPVDIAASYQQALEEENRRLREALEPFARVGDLISRLGPKANGKAFTVSEFGKHCIRARALTNNISTGSPAESETSGDATNQGEHHD